MTAATLAPLRLAEAGRFNPSLHPRGPDGRFTESFAALMSRLERGRARRAAAAFKPRRGINTPDGARSYLSGIGKASPAVGTYFGGGHREVNQALRAGKPDYPGVQAMDAAMAPLPDDILVTRRVPAHLLGDATPEQLVGFKVADAGYTAASVATMDAGPGDVLMHIAVPKGTRAAVNPDNGAIVLDRGLELAVLHVAPNNHGGKDMYLTVLPKDGEHGDGRDGGLPHAGGDGGDGGSTGRYGAPEARGGPDSKPAPAAGDTGAGRSDAGGTTAPGGSGDSTPAAARTTGGSDPAGVLQRAGEAATDEPTALGDTDPELRDAIHNAFDVTFGDLSAQIDDDVSQIYRDADGNVVVRAEGYIRKDGKIVGSFRRMLYPGTGEVHNDTFALSKGSQGGGFAQKFATRSEPLLAELGLTHATVSASGVGGYAWRRYGWDPNNPNAKGDVPDRLRSIAAKWDLTPEDRATVQGWLKAFQSPDQSQWPTPSEIGDFGKQYTKKIDGRDMWPGKDVLNDSAWQGRRALNTGRKPGNSRASKGARAGGTDSGDAPDGERAGAAGGDKPNDVSANTPGEAGPDSRDTSATPSDAALSRHVETISAGVSGPSRAHVHQELQRQADLAPRSVRALESVTLPPADSEEGHAYADALGDGTLAFYSPQGFGPLVARDLAAGAIDSVDFSERHPGLWLNPNWHGDEGDGAASAALRRSIDSGWSAPSAVDQPIAATVAHEFGHHIAEAFFDDGDRAGVANMHGPAAERLLPVLNDALGAERRVPIFGDLLEPVDVNGTSGVSGYMLDRWLRQNRDVISAQVSGYATENVQELLAEIWLEYSTMGRSARPHIQTIGELMRTLAEEARA